METTDPKIPEDDFIRAQPEPSAGRARAGVIPVLPSGGSRWIVVLVLAPLLLAGCLDRESGAPAVCGDGVRQSAEPCDGADLGASSCVSLGYASGLLRCNAQCQLDPTGCMSSGVCGNGLLDTGEQCDGAELAGQSCEGLGLGGGALACDGGCALELSGCTLTPVCGDGVVHPGEACDDGNLVDCDGCAGSCRAEGCGDGVVECGEACDDGNQVGGDGCAADCDSDESCGNGVLDLGEACDDGNQVGGDGCAADCSSDESCGNGLLDLGEACDDGNQVGGDGCAADCSSDESCGNGVLDPGEACDDGNQVGGDGCTADCGSDESCGNGVLDPGEICDDGTANSDTTPGGCRTSCVVFYCGDGVIDPGETCDDSGANSDTLPDACRTSCLPAACGDGVADSAEGCDDGSANSDTAPDACRTSCAPPGCGDAVVDSGEDCDGATLPTNDCSTLGYVSGTLGCLSGCVWDESDCSRCGDGVLDTGEACDSSNLGGLTCVDVTGHPHGQLACDAACGFDISGCHTCGDGLLQGPEQCDGSELDGATCVTHGYTSGVLSCSPGCIVDTSACVSVCGNQVHEPGEECDDGNTIGWDGCHGCLITDFLVNTIISHSQEHADVALNDSGRAVVVWNSTHQWLMHNEIDARIYPASGPPQGAQFQVSTTSASAPLHAAVGMAADGRIFLSWDGQDGFQSRGALAVALTATGSPMVTEFTVNTQLLEYQVYPAVAVVPDGRTIVAWQSEDLNGASLGIFAQRLHSNFGPTGPELPVNTVTSGDPERVAMAADDTGRFVVVWTSVGQDGDGRGIFGRHYDDQGVPVGVPFQVNTHTPGDQLSPAVSMAPDGRFVVAWTSHGQNEDSFWTNVYYQRFSAVGVPVGGETLASTTTWGHQGEPDVAMAADGSFVVVWTEELIVIGTYSGGYREVRRRRFDSAGVPLADEESVSQLTTEALWSPAIASTGDGRTFVVWAVTGVDTDDEAILGQRFAADGTRRGLLPW